MRWVDTALFVALTAVGIWMAACRPWGLDAPSAASLAGALFGAAAVLLGNGINRYNDHQRAGAALEERRHKLKALITAELVNVVAGLLPAKTLLDAAVTTARAGGNIGNTLDLSRYRPRPMAFTASFGAELLALETADIDTLAMARGNLAITAEAMDRVTTGAENFGLMRATELSNALAHDMTELAKTFERIAPARQIQLPGEAPELVSALLRRKAAAP